MTYTAWVEVTRVDGNGVSVARDIVVKESPITLYLNDKEFTTLICSPVYLKELAVGFLCSEGILQKRLQNKVLRIMLNVYLKTSQFT